MLKRREIVERDLQKQNKVVKQLDSTDLVKFSHGEERSTSMRDGFYSRRSRVLY